MRVTTIRLLRADIATLDVDAVVNAANDRLWMGSGVAGALKRAGGEEIEREALAQAPIPIGEAAVTTAGRLPAIPACESSIASLSSSETSPAGPIRLAWRNRRCRISGVSSA